MTMNIDRYEQYLREGRLVRHEWVGEDVEGRETACWLAALFDEVIEGKSATSCPADQLPPWFANLIPWMDDNGTQEKWLGFARRLAAVLRAPRTADQWHRAEYAVRALIVRDAMRNTKDEKVLAACDRIAVLCEGVAAGADRDDAQFAAAAAAAEAARWAAAAAAAEAAEAARWAAAAAAAAAAEAARWAAAEAAAAAAADRIIDGILTVLEQQVAA